MMVANGWAGLMAPEEEQLGAEPASPSSPPVPGPAAALHADTSQPLIRRGCRWVLLGPVAWDSQTKLQAVVETEWLVKGCTTP